ncbi:MAG: exodeoxyribonuclease VII large subunit [Alphaproteobacteria bacterium]|nr:exodeoxyribonuclease VII large subunit [Alphaproteobacteria bacterium]
MVPMVADITHNLPEYSVSELSLALKRTVEDAFGNVRVRGEISGFKRHGSGHCYLRLKDDQAVLDAVIWKGVASRLTVKPEEGLEVIVTGRITTYPGRSSYQIIIESMTVAGVGALLKLLEDRRRKLAAEGLFEVSRKRKLPFLPEVIGVITSPTGAVIRDILHRLSDRCPRHVLIWPVAVQGEDAAGQIAAAIAGFNRLTPGGRVPRPDLLIVARGGGSLEDLWAFNEEVVVRAAAASVIPLISAVGHETDTTLIDFAADLRAPTPTAAAELAVPVRLDLMARVSECEGRLRGGMIRRLEDWGRRVDGLRRGLPEPGRLQEAAALRLDDRAERMANAMAVLLERRNAEMLRQFTALPGPREYLAKIGYQYAQAVTRLGYAMTSLSTARTTRYDTATKQLRPQALLGEIDRSGRELGHMAERFLMAGRRVVDAREDRLDRFAELLASYSYEAVLNRGYSVVWAADGRVIESAKGAEDGSRWAVEFKDGKVRVAVDTGPPPKPRPRSRKQSADQGDLF